MASFNTVNLFNEKTNVRMIFNRDKVGDSNSAPRTVYSYQLQIPFAPCIHNIEDIDEDEFFARLEECLGNGFKYVPKNYEPQSG